MTGRRLLTLILVAELVSGIGVLTGAVLATFADWPRTWTGNERSCAWAIALDLGAGFLIGRALRSRRAEP